ncbi:MAG: uncharacterized protein KVP18_004717 [Porospora cf. gigantea A]|uniref:uncharacterized protein n=2 Tax=Porospora cf. gigantea A TaxID=2853593 RepID=UPI0035595D71|nr:MAG: hypothetical protein KVP18_004717 [Porospora cf. gigantea A]
MLIESKSVHKQVTATAEHEDSNGFIPIDKLQSLGINVADINKLKSAGLCTVLSVVQSTRKELCNVKGLSEAKVEKITDAASKLEVTNCFLTGTEVLEKRKSIVRITSGCEALDSLLAGGFESTCITELFGENRCGKTQVCHTLCVTAQLPLEMNGGNGKVCFIDTEGTFRPEKITKIAERFGLPGDAVLDNILYARAFTHEHMLQLILVAAAKMVEEHFSLLVIDSIMALFRVDFTGRGELADRQQQLGKTLSRIMKIAEQFNIVVVYTNHVMADPGNVMAFGPTSKPIGGHVMGHASTVRLSLKKGKGEQRICKVFDAPNLPESEAIFVLSEGGVTDAQS